MAEIRSFEQNQIDAILADAARSLAEDRPDEAMRLIDKHQARLAKTAATECRAAVLASRALELTGEMEASKQRAVAIAQADAIRAQLTAEGVQLKDGPQGTTWVRA